MELKKIQISNNSLIHHARQGAHFEECYSIKFLSEEHIDLEQTVHKCFSSFLNGWTKYLFQLRDLLVKPFKLLTIDKNFISKINTSGNIEKGGKVAFFNVKDRSDTEVLLFAKDKHLSANFSIEVAQHGRNKTIKSSMTVQFNNTMGKVYFSIIKPFHKLIVKRMLRKIAKGY